jgi:Flp pilus assembly pilin Flp
MHMMLSMIRDEDGAQLVEYGVLLMLVALVAMSSIALIGPEINGIFTNVASVFYPKGVSH